MLSFSHTYTLACQHAETATSPLVGVYIIGVYVADKNPIVVIIQVVPT